MSGTDAAGELPGYRRAAISRRNPDGADTATDAAMADEVAVEIHLNQQNVVVTMASPVALEDLAVGFLISEQYLPKAAHIVSVECFDKSPGIVVNVRCVSNASIKVTRRNVAARASCGLCGVASLDDAIAQLPALQPESLPDAGAVHAALAALRDYQPLNQLTRAVHGAAWCTPEGGIALVREDIGRHNALDKLLGARVRASDTSPGFVLMTSRVSYEIVQKAAAHDVATLVAVSAPTTLAVDIARSLNMNLIAIARGDNHSIFVSQAERYHEEI